MDGSVHQQTGHQQTAHPDNQRVGDRTFNIHAYDADYNAVKCDWQNIRWQYLRSPMDYSIIHSDAIIVAVDGACRSYGSYGSRTAAGIFFHVNNTYWNTAMKLGQTDRTTERAVLNAAKLALEMVHYIRRWNNIPPTDRRFQARDGPLRKLSRVVIMTDSLYLVNGMVVSLDVWRGNGYLDVHRRLVVNHDLFRVLDGLVLLLNSLSVRVQFWHVPAHMNRMADALAEGALDGQTPVQSIDRLQQGH